MINKPTREIKMLEEELIYYDWRVKNAPDLETANKFYELGVEKAHIYNRLLGHFPTRIYQPLRNKMRGNK